MTESDDLCPLCGHSLPEVGSRDRDLDHVFGQALGGRKTVDTHRTCNNNLGSGPEGVLAQAASIINLIRSFHGLAVLPVPAVAVDGTRYNVDFTAQQMTPARPTVRVEQTSNEVHLFAEGSEEQLRGVIRGWRQGFGAAVPTFDELPSGSRNTVVGPSTAVTSTVSLDLAAAEQYAIKTALDSGVLAFGPAFAGSAVAVKLREWRDAPFDNPLIPGAHRPRCSVDALKALDLTLREHTDVQSAGLRVGTLTLPSLTPRPEDRVNSVTFVPLRSGSTARTAVFVHALSFPLPPYGIVVEADLPHGAFGRQIAPVVVQEDSEPLRVTNLTEALFTPVAAAARRAEAAMLFDDSD